MRRPSLRIQKWYCLSGALIHYTELDMFDVQLHKNIEHHLFQMLSRYSVPLTVVPMTPPIACEAMLMPRPSAVDSSPVFCDIA